ncbi:nitrilase-related carbon-nitrogen hydrolase [Pseudomonas sp. RHF3.3-3]|uniref:nitrilase-related carbon-nitrogen hydrolase n=1 Tax=Pseudomonas sp. RHF3.3-3 TaxID=3396624 RepID=UPI003A86C882
MPINHPKYRVAAVQAAPESLDLEATLEKAVGLMQQAASAGASLIAFPENFFPGYPIPFYCFQNGSIHPQLKAERLMLPGLKWGAGSPGMGSAPARRRASISGQCWGPSA